MKNRILIVALIIVAFTSPAFSQENDSLAKVSFATAQNAFANGQYKETVDYIKYAEIYAGGANPKSLYLKIRALDQLTNRDASYLPSLQSALGRFFEITDKNMYPSDKYQEITAIMTHWNGPASTPTVIPPATSKNAAELADYQKAIKANTIEAYKEFLDTYSYTPHYAEIKNRYDDLVEDRHEYRHHRIN